MYLVYLELWNNEPDNGAKHPDCLSAAIQGESMVRQLIAATLALTLNVAVVALHADAHSPGATSPVLHTLTLSTVPQNVAVDPLLARAFVTSVHDYDVVNAAPPLTGMVTTLDTRTGTILRTLSMHPLPNLIAVDPLHARVFVTQFGGPVVGNYLSILNATTGVVVHKLALPVAASSLDVDQLAGLVIIAGIAQGPTALATSTELVVIDARYGRILGAAALTENLVRRQVGIDETAHHLFEGTLSSGTIRMFDERTAQLLRVINFHERDGVLSEVSVDATRHRLFVVHAAFGEYPATLSALDTRTGRVIMTRPVTVSPVNALLSSDPASGHLFIITSGDPGRVLVFSEQTGLLLRTSTIGVNPGNALVDTVVSRLFVLNTGPQTYNTNTGGLQAIGASSVSVIDSRNGNVLGSTTISPHTRLFGATYPLGVDNRHARIVVIDAGNRTVNVLNAAAF